jgi:hypothetical protein
MNYLKKELVDTSKELQEWSSDEYNQYFDKDVEEPTEEDCWDGDNSWEG